jgi:hypothetical protein
LGRGEGFSFLQLEKGEISQGNSAELPGTSKPTWTIICPLSMGRGGRERASKRERERERERERVNSLYLSPPSAKGEVLSASKFYP